MPHQPAAVVPPIDRALARLARRLRPAGQPAAWAPPPPADLIARIESALAERRAIGVGASPA